MVDQVLSPQQQFSGKTLKVKMGKSAIDRKPSKGF